MEKKSGTNSLVIEFGFNYDEEKNLLIDRANRNIKDICNKYDVEIREQQEIINERTTELFKKIIMDELVLLSSRKD